MNRYIICVLATACLLVGCRTTAGNTVYHNLVMQRSAEERAWGQMSVLAENECGANVEKVGAKGTAKKESKCITALVEEHVLSYAVFPDLVKSFRDKAEFLSGQYADGKLSENERHYAGVQAWDEYWGVWNARANQMIIAEDNRINAQRARWGSIAGQIADDFRPDPVTACQPTLGGGMRCTHSP